MITKQKDREFELGIVRMTKNASCQLEFNDVISAFCRFKTCDWGDVCDSDGKLNDEALETEARIIGIYTSSDGVKFWIITEWDRSATTVLLPEDY